MNDDFYHVEAAIKVGELAYARECLRDILQIAPSAEAWYLAALVARTPEQRIVCLEKALLLDPNHTRARMTLDQTYQQLPKKPLPPSPSPLVNWLRHMFGNAASQ